VITVVAGLAVVVVVALLLFVTLGGDDAPVSPAAGTPLTSAAPSSSAGSSSAGSSSDSSPSGGFSQPPGTIDPAAFVAQLPADLTDCAADQPAGDGDVAAASCGAATTQPGPTGGSFFLYPDQSTLDAVFQSDVTDQGLTEFAADADCGTGTGYGQWAYADYTPGGQVACQLTDDGHVVIVWTDDEFLTEGAVRAPGTTQAEVSALYDWWTANSEFQN
jgi:hypothetical protein